MRHHGMTGTAMLAAAAGPPGGQRSLQTFTGEQRRQQQSYGCLTIQAGRPFRLPRETLLFNVKRLIVQKMLQYARQNSGPKNSWQFVSGAPGSSERPAIQLEEISMRSNLKMAALVILASGSIAAAQSLATLPQNNGSGGVFMDLTPIAQSLDITSFEVSYSGPAGTPVEVEVWVRPGSYVGFDESNAGWTLNQVVSGQRAGASDLTPLTLSFPLTLDAGITTAVYLHCITAGGGIRYQGWEGTAQTQFSNADLMLFSDVARTGNVPFGGYKYTPRAFAGVINYLPGGSATVDACCFPNGSCQQLLEASCIAQGGAYQGPNTDCATANCPQPPTGACCFADGSCMIDWEPGCLAQGGLYRGDGTDCASVTCINRIDANSNGPGLASTNGAGAYFLVEATDLAGIEITGFDINTNALAGTPINAHVYFRPVTFVGFTGDKSAWMRMGAVATTAAGRGNPTPVPVGGLKIGGGETWAVRISTSAGVRYTGSSTPPSFSDSHVTLHMGEIQDSFFGPFTWGTYPTSVLGWDGSMHYLIGPTINPGSCCLPDGSCAEVQEIVCTAQEGTYHGDGTTCATTPTGGCPQPATGACCFNDGSCIIDQRVSCTHAAGTYMGDNTTCAGVSCPTLLDTAPPNNGLLSAGSGIFLDLTASDELTVLRIDYVASTAAGSYTEAQIWTRSGSYVGWDSDPSAWTLHDTVSAWSAGPAVPVVGMLNNPIVIEANETIGIYIMTQFGGISYTGSGPQQHYSDANLALFSDLVRSNPWGGSTFTPRVFSGTIHYIMGGRRSSQACYANCDGSTTAPVLNVDDFSCFINEYATAQALPDEQQIPHYANCDRSTTPPVLNVDDFICFINEFAQGCP
jgi:hypothetical protein